MRKIFLLFAVLLLTSSTLMAQNRTITGTVRSNDKNEPLIGVAVQVKGSNVGTTTDTSGHFSLTATNLQSIVVGVRYIGYAYQEKTLRIGEMNADFKLVPISNSLDEVVVVGYGTQKKVHLTGAVATINTKAIQDIPTTNLSEAIKGQLPNVSVSGGDTRPGAAGAITIRNPKFGNNLSSPTTTPLYIIDDAFRTPADFNLLDQSEVESISILKDGAAAIYGVQGANGVIIVKTKHGKAGAAKVEYAGSYGLSDAAMLPKMMTGLQQATYLNDYYQTQNNYNLNELGFNTVTNAKVAGYYTPDELSYFANPANETYWLPVAWKTATVERHALNVSGGTDKATFFAGGSYVKQGSNFDGVNTDKWTYRASADAKVAKGLKVGLSVSGDIYQSKSFWFKTSGESLDDDVGTLAKTPQWTKYYIDGNPVLLTPSGNASKDNINFFEIQKSGDYTQQNNYILNVAANGRYDVPFVPGLSATITYNRNINNFFGKQYGSTHQFYQYSGTGTNGHIPGGTIVGTPPPIKNGDRVRLNPNYTNTYQLNDIINYQRKFGKHDISFLALYEQSENYMEGVAAEADGTFVGGKDNQNFTYGTQSTNQASLVKEYGRKAYATRLDYNYDSKYILQLAFRADANTNFAPGHQWGYFPSGSAGWVMSDEGFFKNNIKFVNFFKIRGSVGLLGNDNTSPWQFVNSYKFATGHAAVFGNGGGSSNTTLDRGTTVEPNILLANPDVTWDSNLKVDVGFDAEFFSNRLSVSADYYHDHRYNMLTKLSASVPFLIGATLPAENKLSINSFGYEISVGWKDHIGKDFTYNFNPYFAWSDARNVLIDQPTGNIGTYLDVAGKSDDPGFLGYRYLGIFKNQAQVDSWLTTHPGYTIFGEAPQPGMPYYQDVRGPKDANNQYTAPDGKIDSEDLDYIAKKSSNHYNVGLNFGGSYKSITLGVTMGISYGGYGQVEGDARATATALENAPAFWADHWTPTNQDAKYPAPYFSKQYNVPSALWYRSSTTFKVTNMNLSYNLPKKFADALGVASLRVYAVATNPFNFYNPYSDYRDNGSTFDTYPTIKTYSFGLNVGF